MKKKKYISIFLAIIISMSIGYAALSESLNINGVLSLKPYSAIVFVNVDKSGNTVESENSSVNGFGNTSVDLSITLEESSDSSVKYKIRLFNRSNDYYRYEKIIDDTDNNQISYTLENLNQYDSLPPKEYYEFFISFAYKEEDNNPSNNILNTLMNFKFKKMDNKLKLADKVETSKYALSVMLEIIDGLKRRIDSFKNTIYYDETDINDFLFEMNVMLEEIHWIYNTEIFKDKLFSSTEYDRIKLNDELIELSLNSLESSFPTKITVDNIEEAERYLDKYQTIIQNDLNEVNNLSTKLKENSIYGKNHIDVEQEVNILYEYLQNAEESLSEIHSIIQRMNELTVQASNGTSTDIDVQALNTEYQALLFEIDRIMSESTYNGEKVFENKTFKVNGKNINIEPIDISTFDNLKETLTIETSLNLIEKMEESIKVISNKRAILGAYQNMIEYYFINNQ